MWIYLGEKGDISCLSLAQLMAGGGTLWTTHGKTASSPSITDILDGSEEPPTSPALDLGRTGKTYIDGQTEMFLDIHLMINCKVQMLS